MNEAFITGEIIRWARERSGLSYADIAGPLHVSAGQVAQWEEEKSYPPFGKARDLANLLRIPFGYLFLSTPPVDRAPIPDCRTVADKAPSTLSPDFLEVMHQVIAKQEWYREYCEQNSYNNLDYIGRFHMDQGVEVTADDIRTRLSIDESLRHQSRNHAAYLTGLSNRAQDAGILVMRSGVVGNNTHRLLDVSEFRGFALPDQLAPVVFLNSRDSTSAQVFTLIHELAHIWTNQSGISNSNPIDFSARKSELFCNEVAAQVLVPTRDFQDAWSGLRTKDTFPAELSRLFWVSPLVVIRRAYDLEKVREDEFFQLVKTERSKTALRRGGKGGDPLRSLLSRNSHKLTQRVLDAVRENRLMYRDAAQLLAVSNVRIAALLKKRIG